MDTEQAIKTALEYERSIRDLYLEAVQETDDPTGRRVFKELADDEQYHLELLEKKLEEWTRTGAVTDEALRSALPDLEKVRREAAKLQSRLQGDDRGLKVRMLGKALKLELETSSFYKRLVEELSDEAKSLFSRFLEVENQHVEIVQFELDHVAHNGYWFGFEEFNLEVE